MKLKLSALQSFQEALERGETTHLMPVFNAKEKIKSGKLRPEDIPVSIVRVHFACDPMIFLKMCRSGLIRSVDSMSLDYPRT